MGVIGVDQVGDAIGNSGDEPSVYTVFDCLRFTLILLVIYIHNSGTQVYYADRTVNIGLTEINLWIINFVSQGIARIAVPLFYFMSAYLFFFSGDLTSITYRRKLQSRVKSLVIPFLFWNVVWLAFKFALQASALTRGYFNPAGKAIADYGLYDLVNAIIGIDGPPNAYQFWFIRDLIILMVLSPIVYQLIRRMPFVVTPVLLILWFCSVGFPFYFSMEALTYFVIGGLFGYRKVDPAILRGRGARIAGLVVTVAAFAISSLIIGQYGDGNPARKIGILLGVFVAISWARVAADVPSWRRNLSGLSAYAFFVFAIHEPTLTVVRKIVFRISPDSNLINILLYLAIPCAIAAVSLVLCLILLKIAPKQLVIVTGGRG